MALGLRIRKASKDAALTEAETWLKRLGLEGFGGRFPHELSGGQRKRVAIAQVLVLKPKLLLMDEPFASLDAIVRTRLTQELLTWVEQEHMSVLLVTHDLEEALTVSDTVYRDVLATRQHPSFAPLLAQLWRDMFDEASPARVETIK